VELSPWHLQEEQFDDLDEAMAVRPVPDETRSVTTETEVAALLNAWRVDPETLRPPAAVDYPEPPPAPTSS
jgi:hypothetical protein